SVAEHWLYVPSSFALIGAITALGLFIQDKWRRQSGIITIAFVVFTVFLGMRTFIRTFDWKDQRTFLERTIASGGDSARMLINLGGLESTEGRFDLAKKNLMAALSREPGQPLAVISLAVVALKQDDLKTARELLPRAAQMPFVDAQALELLAVLESKEEGLANPLRLRLAARTGPPTGPI